MIINARIVADSVSPAGVRLVTMALTYPRFIHAEFMTHRMFSRNAASSRAIPISKMMERVGGDPALPVHWGSNQAGMQANGELPEDKKAEAMKEWLKARDNAIRSVNILSTLGLHKQVANRLLEPWSWITTIMTATDFANFLALRCHPDAQPEFRVLAECVREELDTKTPTCKEVGEWHLPFIRQKDRIELEIKGQIHVSVARCARVSYLTHEGERDIQKDLDLYERLMGGSGGAGHWSPFEHVAQAVGSRHFQSGNFRGWRQYRKIFETECIKES